MKCPLRTITIIENVGAVVTPADIKQYERLAGCLKEECALWWNGREMCSIAYLGSIHSELCNIREDIQNDGKK